MTEDSGAGLSVELGGQIVLGLGNMIKQLQLLRTENRENAIQLALARIRNVIPLTQSVVTDASGNGVVELGTPAQGRTWTVRLLNAAVQGGELSTNAAANIAWYIGVNVPSGVSSLQATSQWRESAAGVPVLKTYTSDIHQLKYGEHLFAVVAGPVGIATTRLVFNAVVLDEPMKVGVPVLQG